MTGTYRRNAEIYSGTRLTERRPVLFDRCQEVGSEERRKERREEKCPFLENSGSEEDVLQILQYMATILGKNMMCANVLTVTDTQMKPSPKD